MPAVLHQERASRTSHQVSPLGHTLHKTKLRFHRKHTGERPFACHCERKFSRLDNLRQHAQTVHSNEVIPEGSLALSGGNFRKTRNGGGTIPAAQRARDIQMRQDSPGRHHVAVPGRGSHGWVPGHRRGAHSMPVNQMQPMYTSQTDPRTGYHYPHVENSSARGSVYPHPDEAYHAGPYTPPSNRSSGNFDVYHPSQMPSPAYSHAGEQRFPPQRRQSISGGIGPYQQPPHLSRGPQLPPLRPVRETHTASQYEYQHQQSPASSRFDPFEDRRRTWNGGEYPAYTNQTPAVFDPFRDDPRPRDSMMAHRPAPISHIDPSLRDSPGPVQLAPIRNLENILRPRTSQEQETYQHFSMREREQHHASPASLAQDVQRMEINHPRQRSIFRDDHGRVFTRDERGDVYFLHEASRPSYHEEAPRPSIEDVPRPYYHEDAARPAYHTEEAPRPSYRDDAAADWAAETQKRIDEAREAEARAADAAAALHDLHQSKR